LRRNGVTDLGCDERKFFAVVKMGFNQRRKTLRNALRAMQIADHPLLNKRAEQLGVAEFVELTNMIGTKVIESPETEESGEEEQE
jgi:16S rRNA (adenine1518-N6/adenine1519-N6)-dimethyltransferase